MPFNASRNPAIPFLCDSVLNIFSTGFLGAFEWESCSAKRTDIPLVLSLKPIRIEKKIIGSEWSIQKIREDYKGFKIIYKIGDSLAQTPEQLASKINTMAVIG